MSRVVQKDNEECEHNYCPHLHFKRCRKERERGIPYTYRPIKEIDLTCNVHPKCLNNLTTRNISTLAYQNYTINPVVPDQEEANFSKNFYLQNCPQNYELRNTLVRDMEQELSHGNAYVLAVGAREEYEQFENKRNQHLKNARRRADHAFHQFLQEKEQRRKVSREEQGRWITQYYRKVEVLKDHIFGKKDNQNDDPNVKDKMFLKEQDGNNAKKLSGIKVHDPQAAMGILVALRAVLLKKKVDLQQVRQDQEHNKSVSASYADTSNTSQNVSSASFVSAASNATNTVGESHMAEQFCDFDVLKKKWGKQNVEEVRDILRVMLCRDVINKAEGVNMREKRQARQKDEFLRKEMEKMKKGTGGKNSLGMSKTAATRGKGKGQGKAKKAVFEQAEERSPAVVLFKEPLSKDDQVVKTSLLSGGIYDSVGNIYQRNRNYSQLFKKRAEQSLCEVSFREEEGKFRASTTRVGLH